MSTLKKTALYDFHVQNKGKMVDFAGWSMPVQYELGVLQSHHWTRQNSSIFDVSHMLQTRWTGKDHIEFIESLVVGDIKGLNVGQSTLSVFTNENGGIIDDTVINKKDDKGLYVVSNAGCADKDLKHIHEQLDLFKQKGKQVNVDIIDTSLIALQGPKSAHVLSRITGKTFDDFGFMTSRTLDIKGIQVYISRCGYTGEDGFEEVELAGLGARDSLRLEAGLCLYGNDLDETVTPVEGGLTWTIGQRRRKEGGFLGADKILPQIKGPVAKRRVGLIVEGAPARDHAVVYNLENEVIGEVTSGVPSPTLKKNVAMAYVKSGFHKQGTELQVKVRNKMQKAQVVKMPFVPHKYYY
ncbi:hypothetical protein EDD86DRAFT_245770 [Gorgonomyces haynaldii]|nr:hypothetical protein EDD86DRAFT_245770 [Gorgonomyces haynaldii]